MTPSYWEVIYIYILPIGNYHILYIYIYILFIFLRFQGNEIAGYVEKLYGTLNDYLREVANIVLKDMDVATYLSEFKGDQTFEEH